MSVTLHIFKDHKDDLQVVGLPEEKRISFLAQLLQPLTKESFEDFFEDRHGEIILIGPLGKMKRDSLRKVMDAFAKHGGVTDVLEIDLPPEKEEDEYLNQHGDCYGFLDRELATAQRETGLQIYFEPESSVFTREDTVLVEFVPEGPDADSEYVSCPRPVVMLKGECL